jgi:hypothetical protein
MRMHERVMGVMRKALLAAAAVLAVSCASQPQAVHSVPTPDGTVQVIDDIYHLTRATPDWVFRESAEIGTPSENQGRYVFKGESAGKDLLGLQLWVKGLIGSADLARFVGMRVRDRLVVAAAGDSATLEIYLANVVSSLSEARYTGVRIERRYWWQVRTARADGGTEDVFEYFVLFTVDRGEIDAAIMRAFEESDLTTAAGTEEEQAARDRVKSILESEGP